MIATLGSGGALQLRWTAAQGTLQAYRINDSGLAILKAAASTTSILTVFAPGRSTTFQVQAQGTDGSWTSNGPTASVTSQGVDPVQVAPAPDLSAGAPLSTSTSFLYTGADPVVVGVDAGAIVVSRIAILKGHVTDSTGAPLVGVVVRIANHPEFGESATRADGTYDLVGSGGGRLTVDFWLPGYLHVQRSVMSRAGDFMAVPTVVLLPADSHVTPVSFGGASVVARGTTVADARGTRRATLYVPANTTANLTFADGSTQSISSISFRATEFTVGDAGPSAMPGDLPPSSEYTYAAEFGADEVDEQGALGVTFSQPAYSYVENFLGFAVGTLAPSGYYDRIISAWVPSPNGLVIGVLSIAGGVASLDVTGHGFPATAAELAALGVSPDELQQIAALYSPGTSLWRVPLPHLTGYDTNWVPELPSNAMPPGLPPTPDDLPDQPTDCSGSIVECESQVLGEGVPVAGTPFALHYQSDRSPGRLADLTLAIPLTGPVVPAALQAVGLDVQVAGRDFQVTFESGPDQTYTFTWDGNDAYGRRTTGDWPVTVTVSYFYQPLYATPASVVDAFAQANDVTATSVYAAVLKPKSTTWTVQLGTVDQRPAGLGGWSLSPAHVYQPMAKALLLGDGTRQTFDSVPRSSLVYAGNGTKFTSDGGIALNTGLGTPFAVATGNDGSVYVSNSDNLVLRIAPQGTTVQLVAGGGDGGSDDGIDALQASLSAPTGLAITSDGALLIAESGTGRIRKVQNGQITTVAGVNLSDVGPGNIFFPDGGSVFTFVNGAPATSLSISTANVWAEADGRFLFLQSGVGVVEVGTDARVHVVASTEQIGAVNAMAVAPTGELYLSTSQQVFERDIDGTLTTIAGVPAPTDGGEAELSPDGGIAYAADGQPALNNPIGLLSGFAPLAVSPDRTVSFIDGVHGLIRTIDKEGKLWTVYAGLAPLEIAQSAEGLLYSVDATTGQVSLSAPPPPGMQDGQFLLPDTRGTAVFQFDMNGRHLATYDATTGVARLTFGYTSTGQLATITDDNGNVTEVLHDSQGNPTSIIAPFGQVTTLAVDANGYLSQVSDPTGSEVQLQHTASGLLTQLTDARGNVHTITYDATGRLTSDANPAGGDTTLSRQTTSTGYVESTSTVLSGATTHAVSISGEGNQEVTTTPAGLVTTDLRAADGVETRTRPDGTQISTVYFADPRFGLIAPYAGLVTTVLPSGLSATTQSNRTIVLADPSNVLSLLAQTDQVTINGNTWTSQYTAASGGLGSTLTTTSPVGRTTTRTLDSHGRVAEVVRPNILPVQIAYDPEGRVEQIQQGTRTVQMQYADGGYLSSVTDPLGVTTRTARDADGRTTTITDPLSTQTTLTYDASGDTSSVTPAGKPAHQFQYTSLGDTSAYIPPAVDGGSGEQRYHYDADQNLTQISRADGTTVTLQYDAADRLTAVQHAQGTVAIAYDPDGGQVSAVTGPNEEQALTWDGSLLTGQTWSGAVAATVSWAHNSNFGVSAISLNGSPVATYTYDADNLVNGVNDMTVNADGTNGQLVGTSVQSVTSALTYDSYGALATIDYLGPNGPLFHQDYVRDNLGRIVTLNETEPDGSNRTLLYTYDAKGRLTQVQPGDGGLVTTYAYDANGNRLSMTEGDAGATAGFYDAQDRLLSYGITEYAYTPDGELWAQVDGTTGAVTNFTYDALGNLRAVAMPDGGTIDYLVDGMNRRVGQRLNGVLAKQWVWQDTLRPTAELDGQGNVLATYVYATHTNVPDLIEQGGVEYRVLTDHLGSVVAVVDVATGTVAEQILRDTWGGVLQDTNPGFQPFGFAGGFMDPATDLVRFGARDYDPTIGRWTSRDPLLFASATTNLYAYCGNSPQQFVDPSGRRFADLTPAERQIIDDLEQNDVIGPAVQRLDNASDIKIFLQADPDVASGGSQVYSHGLPSQGCGSGRTAASDIHYDLAAAQASAAQANIPPPTLEDLIAHELGHTSYDYSNEQAGATGNQLGSEQEAENWENAVRSDGSYRQVVTSGVGGY